MWLLLAATAALGATPYVGLEWRPLARADLTWVDEQRDSGLAVGEFDGFVRPSLQAFGGAWIHAVGIQGSLGIARLQSTTYEGQIWEQRFWGVIRPELDVRVALTPPAQRRPQPWLMVGGYGDIPGTRSTSNGYTDDEQAIADQDAGIDRARLGGAGFRLGGGVDYRFLPGIAVGADYTIDAHRSTYLGSETTTLSSWVSASAALLLTFEWPGHDTPKGTDTPPSDAPPPP